MTGGHHNLIFAIEDHLKINAWMDDAACADKDPNLFFPERGTHGSLIRQAKAICRTCPVKADCLDYALRHREYHGIWGGTTNRERRRLRAERITTR